LIITRSRAIAGLVLACAAIAAAPKCLPAEQPGDQITAVAAKASPDYIRLRQKDGKFPVEGYSFGNGGHVGGPMTDPSIDKLTFLDVARVIAVPLAEQNYLPDRDVNSTKLLIMVYWGLTDVPPPESSSAVYNNLGSIQGQLAAATAGGGRASDAQLAEMSSAVSMLNMVNQQRAQTDFLNASMIGYDSEGVIGTEYGNYIRGTPLAMRRDALVAEIEANRYFVILMAYDFQLMLKQKKHKLLWETRFSLGQRHNNFDKDLAGMTKAASQYFGQNTHGLVRKEVPLGRVEVGPVESLGTVEK
jgi:hypothetical protein